jgi:hypothetical protein
VLGLTELVVLGAAAARGTQLVVHDAILDKPRERLELWHAKRHTSRLRTFIRDLLGCILCAGFWASTITLAVYHTITGWHGVTLLDFGLNAFAIAAVQVTINLWWDH